SASVTVSFFGISFSLWGVAVAREPAARSAGPSPPSLRWLGGSSADAAREPVADYPRTRGTSISTRKPNIGSAKKQQQAALGTAAAQPQRVVSDTRLGREAHERRAVDPRLRDQLRLLGADRS